MRWRVPAETFVAMGDAVPMAADGVRRLCIHSTNTTGLYEPVAPGETCSAPDTVTGGSIPPAR